MSYERGRWLPPGYLYDVDVPDVDVPDVDVPDVGGIVGYPSTHPDLGAVVQYGQVLDHAVVDAGNGPEPAVIVAWVTGGTSGAIPVRDLVGVDADDD